MRLTIQKRSLKMQHCLKNVDIICTETKENIGRAIGKDLRSTVAIIDEGFARQLKKFVRKACLMYVCIGGGAFVKS